MTISKDLLLPSNKKFGYFFSIIFFLVGAFLYLSNDKEFAFIFLSFFVLTLFLTLFFPSLLTKPNQYWFYFGILLGRIVSPIVLGIIFFVLLTPIALFLKFRSRDELMLKKTSFTGKTYWIDRSVSLEDGSFEDQF